LNINTFVSLAISEDVGRGDLFALITNKKSYDAFLLSNVGGILAGVAYAEELCKQCNIVVEFLKNDGDTIFGGDIIARIGGINTDVLTCERTLLNTLQHASGIATNVSRYSHITSRYGVKLLDTRKTRPLLREFEKYSARIGGAVNHRFGLDDCLMIKDTHRKCINELPEFIKNARSKIPFTSMIELECESMADACDALCLDIDILMCDNMSANDVKMVVNMRNEKGVKTLIEASGGINLDNIESYCSTGVDAISVGSLIHQAVWLDFSMKGV
jgi:nicotinate-nucleotide pyrophosphorylase (carboxylating)